MSAAEALKAARTVGIELVLDGNDLLWEATSEPPAAVLDDCRGTRLRSWRSYGPVRMAGRPRTGGCSLKSGQR